MKYIALRLDSGCFLPGLQRGYPIKPRLRSISHQAYTKKTRIVDVVYHPNINELVSDTGYAKSGIQHIPRSELSP